MYIVDGIAYADNPKPLLKVRGVRPLDGFRLWVRFSTGETRIADCTPLLSQPAFVPLRDPALFGGVYLDCGVPVWNDGEIDIAPEYLYDHGTAVRQETAG